MPPAGSYQPANMLGEHVSATLSQFASLILKVSYNRGADLMVCLAAAKSGSTDCSQGLVTEVKTITGLGIPATSAFPFDGAGSDDQGRTTPGALAKFYQAAVATPYGKALSDALPVLGRQGTAASLVPHSSAAGRSLVKTGNRVVGTPAGQLIVLGNSLAGYIQAKSGRKLTFMIAVGNVPVATPGEFLQITNEQAEMIVAIQQAF